MLFNIITFISGVCTNNSSFNLKWNNIQKFLSLFACDKYILLQFTLLAIVSSIRLSGIYFDFDIPVLFCVD